jgi:hypothetical protein
MISVLVGTFLVDTGMVRYSIFISNMDMESDRKNSENWIWVHPY